MNAKRVLFGCWAAVGTSLLTAAAVLQVLGPPRPLSVRSDALAPHTATIARAGRQPVPTATVAVPDPALEVAVTDRPGRVLPVIGKDGRRPSVVYRAPMPRVLSGQARVALLVDGIGLDRAASLAAIAQLPGAVSLAFSPYADGVEPLENAARAHGHEMLVSVPMEPQGSPLSDEGDRQLSSANQPATNTANLSWAMSSLRGYVGLTGADTGQGGEHYKADPGGFGDVIKAAATRGLLYVDPRAAGRPAAVPGVMSADAVLGGEPDPADFGAGLASLVSTAQREGHAFGIVGPLRPATLAGLVAWARTLPAQGVVLVPVSALSDVVPASADPTTASAAP